MAKRAKDDAMLLCAALGMRGNEASLVRERLVHLGGVRGLWQSGSEGLDGLLSGARSRRLDSMLELAARMASPPRMASRIESADDVAAYFSPRLGSLARETFWVLLLDARGGPIGHIRVAEGTLTACLVHPREVFAAAIRARAAQVILVHNHPSGDPTPSDEDVTLTERLVEAGELLGIPVVDHVIVGVRGHRSVGCGRGL